VTSTRARCGNRAISTRHRYGAHAIVGRIDLADEATAITLAQSRAQLTLPDSSSIDIGETTRVRLGAFNAIDTGNRTSSCSKAGRALHDPSPRRRASNYRFETPTSQIAVRGTDGTSHRSERHGFLLRDCKGGDVTVTVGTHSYELVTGEQAIIIGTTRPRTLDVVKRPCANPRRSRSATGNSARRSHRSALRHNRRYSACSDAIASCSRASSSSSSA